MRWTSDLPSTVLIIILTRIAWSTEGESRFYPNFHCIQQNNYDSMKCTWNHGHSTEWKLKYTYSNTDRIVICQPVLYTEHEASCDLVDDYHQFEEYTFTLSDFGGGENNSYEYKISTTTDDNVRMDPVYDIHLLNRTVTSLSLRWKLPMYPAAAHDVQQIICRIKAIGNSQTKNLKSIAEAMNDTMVDYITGLIPCVTYVVDIKCKVAKSKIWSETAFVNATTRTVVPRVGPELTNGSFSVYKCNSGEGLCLIIYWKERTDAVCDTDGYRVCISNCQFNRTSTDSSVAVIIPSSQERLLTAEVWAVNKGGQSVRPSVVVLPPISIIDQITPVNVEATTLTENWYNISWTFNNAENTDQTDAVYYYWCYGEMLDIHGIHCKSHFSWKRGTVGVQWAVWTINSIMDTMGEEEKGDRLYFGVSTLVKGRHSGIVWDTRSFILEEHDNSLEKDEAVGKYIGISVGCAVVIVLVLLIVGCVSRFYKSYKRYDATVEVPKI